MDPNATLYQLLDALYYADVDDSIAALVNLTTWLKKGGALPNNVDKTEDDAFIVTKPE